MANSAMVPGPGGSVSSAPAVDRLRALTDTQVTLVTREGEVGGLVLSCTRSSVWLVGGDDVDVVVPLAEILDIVRSQPSAA